MDAVPGNTQEAKTPFDQSRLDRLMEEADLDFLIAASKHNVQYLLGGYKFIFFSAMDAIGHSRYLPLVIYEKGRPDNAAYIGNRLEGGEHQNRPFWTPTVHTSTWGSLDAAALAAEHFAKTRPHRCAHRHRAGLPAVGRLHLAQESAAGGARLRRHPDLRAHARAEDAGGAREAAHRLRADHRFHARYDRRRA